jgi:hypothetical protein
LSGCETEVTFATSGGRLLVLTATDPEGETGADSVTIGVAEAPTNYPPTITVGDWPEPDPLGGEPGYDAEFPIAMSASASDPEGDTPITYEWRATSYEPGAATGIVWESDVVIGTEASLDWTPTDTPSLLVPDNCTVEDSYAGQRVRVTLVATDGLGNSAQRVLPDIYVYVCILI